jgi:hypothetical protein
LFMTVINEGNRLELFGDSDDIMRFLADLKKLHLNLSKMSGSQTNNLSTGESGLKFSFTCRTEEGDIEMLYREEIPSFATIDEAEEMRIYKRMTIKVPQAVHVRGNHQDILDLAKKWLANIGVSVEMVVTNGIEID